MKRTTDKNKSRKLPEQQRQPAVVLAPAVRLVLLCVMSAAFIMMPCELYEFEELKWVLAGIAAGASALVYILASLLPPSLVYGGVVLAGGGVLWIFRERAYHYAQYFWDYMMLKLDSRLIDTSRSFIHSPARIKAGLAFETAEMRTGILVAAAAVIVLAAVIFTAAVLTRFHLSVPVIAATIVLSPAVAAERAGYIPSFFLFAVCVFGLVITTSSFELELGFVQGHLPSARLREHRNDVLYYKRTRFMAGMKKLRGDSERFHSYAGNSIAVALLAAAVFFTAGARIPDGKGLKYQEILSAVEDIGYRAADAFSSFFGMTFGTSDDRGYFSEGGYNDTGSSISIAPPGNSDRPVLEVTLSRNDVPVYLRGDMGVNYHSGSWSGIKTVDSRYRSMVPQDFYPETEYQMFRKYLAYTFSPEIPDKVFPLQMVSVRYLRNTRVIFQPLAAYELNYRTNPQYECFSDFILRTRQGYVKNYTALALTPNVEKYDALIFMEGSGSSRYLPDYSDIGVLTPPEGMTAGEYEEATELYNNFIYDTYLTGYPGIKRLMGEFDIPDSFTGHTGRYDCFSGYYRYSIGQRICDYFAENFTYSLDADNGEDQLNGFLYDTHSGHCALFATAMTLAMREYGIPARYVTGYVVEGEGEPVADGYKYVLTERQLHAWVEVYFKNIGWIAFDPTLRVPGFAEVRSGEWDGTGDHDYGTATKPAETEPPEPETTTGTSAPDEPEPAVTTTGTDSSEDTTREPDGTPGGDGPGGGGSVPKAQQDIFVLLLPYLVAAALIAAVIIIAVMFASSLKRAEKNVFRGFRELPPAEACTLMYRFTLALLARKDLQPGFEQFYDFAERVDGSIELKGANVFMMDVMPVFEKCEFGGGTTDVTEDERASVYRFVTAVYGKLMDDYPALKRFFVKISLFL